MNERHWNQFTLHTMRLVGTAAVLILCIAGRDAVDNYRCWRASGSAMLLTVGDCTIQTPLRRLNIGEGQRRSIQRASLHCPSDLLNSLGLKAALQCANNQELTRLPRVGQTTAGRVFEYRNMRDWLSLKQRAKLSDRQLEVLKAHFVLSNVAISCPS